jgi:Tfp pilus assembly protein PilE
MRIAWLLLALAACHKDSTPAPGGPASTAEVDALWKLAPDGTAFGVVASPKAMQMFEHGYGDVTKFLGSIPELAPPLAKLTADMKRDLGTDVLTFDAVGMSSTKGGIALFMRADKRGVVVLPVTDRDKFLKLVHGTKGEPADTFNHDKTVCMTTHGFYMCASDKEMFDLVGKAKLDVADANARGDIELRTKDFSPDGGPKVNVALVGQLSRGQVTFRGVAWGFPMGPLTQLASPGKPHLEGGRTTGFALAYVKQFIAMAPFPSSPQIGGVSPADVAKTIDDPITMTSQSSTIEFRVPLSDIAPMKTMLEHCVEIGAAVGAKLVDGACEITVPNLPGLPIDLWIEDKALHVGQKHATKGESIEMSALGKELATNDWHYAFYGRGSILASTPAIWESWRNAQQLFPQDMTMMLHGMVRALAMINEVGIGMKVDGDKLRFVFGMRTGWASSDEVVAKIAAINPDDVIAGKGPELAKSIAPAGSPLANDIKAGYLGMMAPTALVGVLGAVAVPAFMEYMKRGKASEVSLTLNRIGKSLKRYYGENSTFPIGDAPLTPAGSTCCGQPNNKCAVDAAAFSSNKVWSTLEFQLDEPTPYQYRYHSDGKTAVVEAIGDLDCDGQMATFTMTAATTANGNPRIDIVPPPVGTY